MHVKTGDLVVVISGKEKGLKGKVLQVLKEKNRVVVEGRNMIKRHMKPNPLIGREGGIIEKEASIHASNVLLYSEKLDGPVRVQRRFVGSEGSLFATKAEATSSFPTPPAKVAKVRYSPKSGERFE